MRSFGIVPAAGHSLRMGRPKLLLPWQGRPLIAHTLAAWQASRVDRLVVVVRPGDEPLAEAVRACGVQPLVPAVSPADMKESVWAAVQWLDAHDPPAMDDPLLVAPADLPQLSAAVIDRLLARHAATGGGQLLVPTLQGRRGHPLLFPWAWTQELPTLPEGEGLRALFQRHPVQTVACDDLVTAGQDPFLDLDLPHEYARLTEQGRGQGATGPEVPS